MTDAPDATPDDTDALFGRLKGWFGQDFDKQADWRRDAREDFGFEAGDQLNEEDKARLREMNRPIVIMNRIAPVIDSVSGSEVSNRQEVRYIPREQGDVQVNEVLTAAAKWFRDQCDAEDEESDAFRDTVVCGMGWTETRLDYEEEPDGKPLIERVDPLEMVWDSTAKKRNLSDMRRLFHVRTNIPLDEARALCPGDPERPFEDADYNATWAKNIKGGEKEPNHSDPANEYATSGSDQDTPSDKFVTMVRAQWWERVPTYRVLDPTNPQNIINLDKEQFDDLSAKAKVAGGELRYTTGTKKVFKQAYLGNVLLEIGEAPCKDHFSFKCITGKRDRNANTWFGLCRPMKDPQRWSNKWMMQTMHIMNTSAKGGIVAERGGFFEDDADGESSWSKQDQITWAKQGALSGANPRWMQKPVSQFPASSFNLMEFAISSIRDVSGVSVETLGMRDAQQAASLDLQRKQASMTILQPLFDSLRRYRKEQGRLLLYLIENYLSDGRLIRIVGKDQEQYVPLVRSEGSSQYDVIVDESPTSPNQKEATWAMLQQVLPVIGKMLPPATWLALLKYSPFPSSVQKEIQESIDESNKNQGPPPEQVKAEADIKANQAKTAADIENNRKKTDAEIENKRRLAEVDAELQRQAAMTKTLSGSLAPQPTMGPDGAMIQPQGDGGAAAAIMGMFSEMQNSMRALSNSLNAPKQIVRDPQTGEITAVVPARMQ